MLAIDNATFVTAGKEEFPFFLLEKWISLPRVPVFGHSGTLFLSSDTCHTESKQWPFQEVKNRK